MRYATVLKRVETGEFAMFNGRYSVIEADSERVPLGPTPGTDSCHLSLQLWTLLFAIQGGPKNEAIVDSSH